ncbi:flippase [Candidatus Micrarchaeota archaeon]|nr:flippase [Candidatus Micrarchaeota archaeon]
MLLIEELSENTKEVAKGSIWGLSGNLLLKLVSFFYAIVIARLVSQDDIGIFYLTLGILQIISMFSYLGLPFSLQRYVPFYESRKELGKAKYLLKLSYLIVILASIFFIAGLWISADFIGELYQNALLAESIRLFSVYLFLYGVSVVQITYLQGRTAIRSMQLAYNVQNVSKLLLTILFFYLMGPSVFTLIYAFLASFAISDLVSLFLLYRRSRDLPKASQPISNKELFREVMPLGLIVSVIASITVFVQAADKILLGYLLPNSMDIVGVYGIATAFSMLLFVFPSAIGMIFLPIISRLVGKNDLSQIRATTETAMRWAFLISIPVAIIIISFSEGMLGIFYGEPYRVAAVAMAIFTLAVLVKSFSLMLSLALAAMRKIQLELKITLILGIVNVIFNVLLIPSYGMEGAAIASLIAFITTFFLLNHYCNKIFQFKLQPENYKLIIAGATTLIIMLFISPYASIDIPSIGPESLAPYISKVLYLFFLGIFASVAFTLFILFALVLKCFKNEDKLLMKQVLTKARLPAPIISLAEKTAALGVSD